MIAFSLLMNSSSTAMSLGTEENPWKSGRPGMDGTELLCIFT